MQKIDKVVKKETLYIASWVLIFSALMQAVFLIIGKWDMTVLWGNLLSGAAVILNFFLIGITVQNAVSKEEKDAKQTIKASSMLRTLALFIVVVVGVALDVFNTWAVVIPILFPRIAIALRPIWNKEEASATQAAAPVDNADAGAPETSAEEMEEDTSEG